MISSIAASATELVAERSQGQVGTKILKKAMDFEQQSASDLIQSLNGSLPASPAGNHIDIYA